MNFEENNNNVTGFKTKSYPCDRDKKLQKYNLFV